MTFRDEDVNEEPTESIILKLCTAVKSAEEETQN